MHAGSLKALAGELAMICAHQPGATPLCWTVLFAGRPQPLLVPADNSRAAADALGFFIGRSGLRLSASLRLLMERISPHSWRLPRIELSCFPAEALFGRCATAPPESAGAPLLALYVGSPGPLQKIVVLRMATSHANALVAKLALRASADHSVRREAHYLRTLGKLPATAAYVPRLLHAGALAGGRQFIVMNALPEGTASALFDARHRSFLAALGASNRHALRWSESVPFIRLQNRCRVLAPSLELTQQALLHDVMRDITQRIGGLVLPSCLAHGDFAPWNVRLVGERLIAFDWEYAQESANPLHDYFHFHLIARVVGKRALGPEFMRELIARAEVHAGDVFGSDSGVVAATSVLMAHYLLDTVSFYVQESGYLDVQHRVLRAYLELLAERAAWLSPGLGAVMQF